MGRRNGEDFGPDDMQRVIKAIVKHFSSAVVMIGVLGTLVWKVYAEDKITSHVQEQIKPLADKVQKLETNQKRIHFNTKKIELMLIKTLPDSIVEQAEREAQIWSN